MEPEIFPHLRHNSLLQHLTRQIEQNTVCTNTCVIVPRLESNVETRSRKPTPRCHVAFIVAQSSFRVLARTKTILIRVPKLKERLNLDQIVQNETRRSDQIGMRRGLPRIPTVSVIVSLSA